jgi:hypothetical protein
MRNYAERGVSLDRANFGEMAVGVDQSYRTLQDGIVFYLSQALPARLLSRIPSGTQTVCRPRVSTAHYIARIFNRVADFRRQIVANPAFLSAR